MSTDQQIIVGTGLFPSVFDNLPRHQAYPALTLHKEGQLNKGD